jgi:hypothetical protein
MLSKHELPDFDFKISHRNWGRAYSELHMLLTYAEPGEVVCVTGPSRVGKSTLVKEVVRIVCGESDFKKTGTMPFVRVSAANTGQHGTFSTRAFVVRLLNAVEHPIFSVPHDAPDWCMEFQQKIDGKRESDIRLILERSLIHRRTRYVVIDEGQHAMFSKKAGVAPHAVLDSWKCLAEDTGVVLVIVGAYPILAMLQNSPHLLGRKSQIHFPRYLLSKEDVSEFYKIVAVYEEFFVSRIAPESLCDYAEILYAGSLGCIGLLRGWLRRAHALSNQDVGFGFRGILERTAISDSDLREIKKEIDIGEKLLASTIGFVEGNIESELLKSIQPKSGVKNGFGRSKPFQRKPARYAEGNRFKED